MIITAYHGTTASLERIIKDRGLQSEFLRAGNLDDYNDNLELYRRSAAAHPGDPHARLAFLRSRGFEFGRNSPASPALVESKTHVILTSELERALAESKAHDGGLVLRFDFPPSLLEPAPMHFDSRQAKSEILVPGKMELKRLKAVYCPDGKEEAVRKTLKAAGLKRVAVVPVSQL